MDIIKLHEIELKEDRLVIKKVGLYDFDRKFIRTAKFTPRLVEELEKRIMINRDGMRHFGVTFYDAERQGELNYFDEGGEYKPVKQ